MNDRDLLTRKKRIGTSEVDQVLVFLDKYNVNGALLISAQDDIDQDGNPCLTFAFGAAGAANAFSVDTGGLPAADGHSVRYANGPFGTTVMFIA